ncbi:MAG: ADP-ribosylglycohydrolase family protein [Clostridiaceae bacterium]|nr:ADP-ribosylglycohydrolase family protein [Clostridiaceae bacterium]
MLGAIAGDIIGSVYEWHNIKTKNFELFSPRSRFTDDSVLTIATMDSIINKKPFYESYKYWFRKYPNVGFGEGFKRWGMSETVQGYNSYGNGSAMRVSPIGFYFNSLEEVLLKAQESAIVTHNHPEGIKGAQAIAAAIFLARNGREKNEIKKYIEDNFGYVLSESIDSIRNWYNFDVSCQGSIPQAIRSFLESTSYEDAIRNAISIGGDSDTLACIAGGIAEAYYKEIPEYITKRAEELLTEEMKEILKAYYKGTGY